MQIIFLNVFYIRIEGTRGNSAYKILQSAGLAPEPDVVTSPSPKKYLTESVKSESNIYVQSNGDDIPIEDLRPFLDSITDTLEEVYNSTEVLSEFYHKKFNELSDDQQKIGLALGFAQIFAETDSPASDWDQTIGIGFGQKKKLKNGFYTPPGGMKSVLDVLMDAENVTLNEIWKNILKFNSEVTHIDWNTTKPVVSYIDHVKNETHEVMADFVIVTVSLGVLKENHKTMFQPQLPDKMIDAIKSLNFGLENKIYLKFSERWWPEEKELHIIWGPEEKSALQLQDKWLPKIEVIKPYNENTLMIYVMESEKYHSDDLSEQELIDKVMPVIRKAFVNKGWKITDPVKVFHSKWYANPFVRGALTYPTIASYKLGVKNSDLSPILRNSEGRPELFFAGEGTSDDFYGSVHGAIDSGVQAARNIMYS